MRQITKDSVRAFKTGTPFKSSNTKVEIRNNEVFFYLFNNMIAHRGIKKDGTPFLFITTCGWQSATTKERLNGILSTYGLPTISQKNWIWYIGNKEFNGTKTFEL